VTIVCSDEYEKEQEHREKMLNFYLEQEDPTWEMQFKNACVLSPIMNEDEFVVEDVGAFEAFSHFCSIFWKVFSALIPPSSYWNGYPAFCISLAMIGLVTFVVGEVATVLGCALYIKESVTAITFVALGTSLPDTFASMKAAADSDNADAAIGNVTGSNSVNVFLGLGLPWLMGSAYFAQNMGKPYKVPKGSLAFSVFVFLLVAIVCFIVLILRRRFIGGELGGPDLSKYVTGCFLFFLWFIYILLSTLQAYDIIKFE
jgi:solute carrier family 8 (sodium/calcium exchanger)